MARLKIALAAGLLLASSCAVASAESVLRIGLNEDPDILDPTLARTFVGRIVFMALCDKLFDITPDLKIVPQLATGYKWEDDNKSLVISIRDGVLFQDGEPMNASAVKYSIERHLTFPGTTRKGEISPVTSVTVVDDHTVRLSLNQPFSPLLAALSDRAGMIVSPKAAEAEGDKFGNNPVCAGPYKFVERVPQDRIVVEKFDKYWNKDKIKIDRVVYQPIPDTSVRLANLRSGSLDMIERVPPTDVPTVKSDGKLNLMEIGSIAYLGITINTNNGAQSKNPLGQDERVRQALSLSIDRNALSQVVFNGEAVPGNQFEPPGNFYYDKDLPVPARDLDKAKALLKAAGVEHPSFTLMVPNSTVEQQVAQVIQSMAAEAGFDIKLQATEFASSLQLSTKGEMQAFQIGWSGRVDPDGNIYNFVTCNAPLNDGHYCNPEVDKELKAAREVDDPAERLKHYKRATEIMLKELPIIYLYHQKLIYALDKKVTGFVPYPDGLIRLQGMAVQ
ncbi:MAG TPA: ABC transporter substrate-binding protein [Stellaceae bacterium]|nr:ABC transporter substrate-binding protein [Stellaceae bacterium]